MSFLSSPWSLFTSSQPEKLDTYSVVRVNIEQYVLQEIVDGYLEGGLRLHKVNVNATTWDYNIVLEMTDGTTFSIYRSGNLEESQAYFHQLQPILPVLMVNCPKGVVTLASLPTLTEHIRNHPGQTLLHFAAHFGLLELFTKALAYDYIDAEDRQTGQTPLHVAVQSGKLPTVQAMLSLHPQLDPIDRQGNTVLHLAASSGNLPILKELLNRCQACLLNSDPSGHHSSAYLRLLNALNDVGQTALGLACAHGQSSELLVKELLQRGANLHGAVLDLTKEYLDGHASSYLLPMAPSSTSTSTSSTSSPSSSSNSTSLLWPQLSPYLDAKTLKDGGTPLHWCTGNSRALALWLQLGVDVNARNWHHRTALHVAIDRVDLGAVIQLLSSGADVNARCGDDGGGDTPLHLAVKRALKASSSSSASSPVISLSSPSSVPFANMMAIVQALLVFGVEVNALSNSGGDGQENKLSSQVTARHLVAGSEVSVMRNQLLYVLHTVNASRCLKPKTLSGSGFGRQGSSGVGGSTCAEGCSPNGHDFNGTPFDLPPNICLRNSPVYDPLLMGPVVEAAIQEMEANKKNSKSKSCESWFSSSTKKDTKKKKTAKKLKLLSLDGGGVRGLIMIQLMDFLERATGRKIVDMFDWIAGTSTGGILALMLASGYSVNECRQIYFRFKDEIFVGSRPHPSDKFEAFLQRYVGTERRMCHLESSEGGGRLPRIMVPVTVVDFFPPELKIFRSYHGPEDLLLLSSISFSSPTSGSTPSPLSNEELIWKVARATGAAPSFFSKFEGRYLDGGLIANNPSLDLLSEVQKMAATVRQVSKCNLSGNDDCSMEVEEGKDDKDESGDSFSVGLLVSLGTGLSPSEPFKALDNISLTSYSGFSDIWQLGRVLIEQTTSTDSHVVERAQAWCAGLSASYFRLNPPLSESLPLNETDNVKLVHMLWQTMTYAHRHQDRLFQLVTLMTGEEQE